MGQDRTPDAWETRTEWCVARDLDGWHWAQETSHFETNRWGHSDELVEKGLTYNEACDLADNLNSCNEVVAS